MIGLIAFSNLVGRFKIAGHLETEQSQIDMSWVIERLGVSNKAAFSGGTGTVPAGEGSNKTRCGSVQGLL